MRLMSATNASHEAYRVAALGHELTLSSGSERSALPLKADMLGLKIDVCYVPEADFSARLSDVRVVP